MPNIAIIEKEQLLSWLGGSARLSAKEVASLNGLPDRIDPGKIVLAWEGSVTGPSSVSNPVIILGNNQSDDFFAWATTYVSTFQPFSAFFRVFEIGDLSHFDPQRLQAEKLSLTRIEDLVAIVATEAAMQMGKFSTSLNEVSISTAQATLSYVILQSLVIGMHAAGVPQICDAWTRARAQNTDVELRISVDRVANFWLILAAALTENGHSGRDGWLGALQAGVAAHLAGKELVDTSRWHELTSDVREISILAGQFAGSKEDQLRTLDKIALAFRNSSASPVVKDGVIGYFMARLANGSTEYLSTFAGFSHDFPTSPLWGAFFSIGRSSNDFLVSGQNLGRRLVKSLAERRTFFTPPNADVSLRELEAIKRSGVTRFRTNSALMSVELVPFVNGRFRAVPASRPADREQLRRPDAESKPQPYIDLERARMALRELEEALDFRVPENDANLFGRSYIKKGGSRSGKKYGSSREKP